MGLHASLPNDGSSQEQTTFFVLAGILDHGADYIFCDHRNLGSRSSRMFSGGEDPKSKWTIWCFHFSQPATRRKV